MMSPLISIIIPVYNNQKYFPLAVNSVTTQSFRNWELIIVDDGSTDKTGQIADELAKGDDRIRVIHQSNQWIYASINNGVKVARGEYIFFLNSDDCIANNGLWEMQKALLEYHYPDVIFTDINITLLDENDELIKQYCLSGGLKELYCEKEDEVRNKWLYLQQKKLLINQANLYKRELIKNVSFRNDVYGADTLFNIELFPQIKSCAVIKEPIYNYYEYLGGKGNASSKMYGYESEMFDDFYRETKKMLDKCDLLNEKTLFEISQDRVANYYSIEIKKIVNSELSISDKLEKIFSNNITDVLREAINNIGVKEDFDRYVLRKVKLLLNEKDITSDSKMFFVKELIMAVTSKHISEEVLSIAYRSVYNVYNPFRIGECYYTRLVERSKFRIEKKENYEKKVLWLTNVLLPDISDHFLFKQTEYGGWIQGLWNELRKNSDYNLAICVPIQKKENCKDGVLDNYKYYSFEESDGNNIAGMCSRFQEILSDFQPDIVHVWGTEYPHTLAMIEACDKQDLLDKTVIHIQGIVSECAKTLYDGLTNEMKQDDLLMSSISRYADYFNSNAEYEIKSLEKVKNVTGRTDWDKLTVNKLATKAKYYLCTEILRNEIYDANNLWNVNNINKHSVFMSQASYPLKGLHLVLDTFFKLKETYADLKVRIAGVNPIEMGDSYGEYIKNRIDELGLNETIEFIGNQNVKSMIEEYLSANLFLSASTIENSSNSICEAMLIGVPVVSSNVGGVSSLIEDGADGLLYEIDNSEKLLSHITSIFNDDNYAKQLSEKATISMSKFVDKDGTVEKIKQIYQCI